MWRKLTRERLIWTKISALWRYIVNLLLENVQLLYILCVLSKSPPVWISVSTEKNIDINIHNYTHNIKKYINDVDLSFIKMTLQDFDINDNNYFDFVVGCSFMYPYDLFLHCPWPLMTYFHFEWILQDKGVGREKKPEVSQEEENNAESSDVIVDTTGQHKLHVFDLNCKICTGKVAPPVDESTPKKEVTVAKEVSVEESPKVNFTYSIYRELGIGSNRVLTSR